jgi:hypothetical protein
LKKEEAQAKDANEKIWQIKFNQKLILLKIEQFLKKIDNQTFLIYI